MKEIVIEGNIITVKYEENAYWAAFKSPVMAREVSEDLRKTRLSEEKIIYSPFKFKKV